MLPSPDILNEFAEGKFVLSNLAAKRAKQLREGAPALVRVDSNHPLTIALAEIAAGKITPIMPEPGVVIAPEVGVELPAEGVGSELGLLLPALDEGEITLDAEFEGLVDETEEAHETEVDGSEAEGLALSDLVADHDEDAEHEEAPLEEDETLSLSDIAEQEGSEEEEESAE